MGVDIGGTGIKGAPVDLATGELVGERFRVDTPKGAHPDDVVAVVGTVVGAFASEGPVGITFPGVVIRGTILTAANMAKAWIGLDGHQRFAGALGRPVLLMNDADAAGVAEMRFGAGRDHRRGVVVMVTLGTGIGSALFNDGVLVPNTELGHLELDGDDAEKLASGSARDRHDLSWRAWGKRVQRYLRHLDALLWPDLIIVGGGMSKESARWLPGVSVRCPVVPAALLNNAGIVGAALLADEQAVAPPLPPAPAPTQA
jgi:polyphosphate glucokinase